MSQSRTENQIDYIELPASRMQAAKDFYSTVFGWKFVDYGPDYASFSDGRIEGGLAAEKVAEHILPVIYAKDLNAAQQKIKAAGGTIVKETFSFPGGSRFHFADPNGNELSVWSDAGQS